MKDLEFTFTYKDYALQAVPKDSVKVPDDQTIDLMRSYTREEDGRVLWYSIGYFTRGVDGYYFQFVRTTAFEEITLEDLPVLWVALRSAQEILNNFFEITNND